MMGLSHGKVIRAVALAIMPLVGFACADPYAARETARPRMPSEPPAVTFTTGHAPAVVAVDTRRPSERAFLQTITLENSTSLPNENRVEVQLDLRRGTLADTLGLEPRESVAKAFDRARLDGILAVEFPDVRMRVSETMPTNRYDYYGYAAGRGPAGETCVLAWQVADGAGSGLPHSVYRMGLQFRYCGVGRSVADLLALFEGVTLRPTF